MSINEITDELKKLYSFSLYTTLITDDKFEIIWINDNSLNENILGFGGNALSLFEAGFVIPDKSMVCTGLLGGIPYRYNIIRFEYEDMIFFIIEIISRDIIQDFISVPVINDYMNTYSAKIRQAVFGICNQAQNLFSTLEENENYEEMRNINLQMGDCYKILKSSAFQNEALKYTYNVINEQTLDLSAYLKENQENHEKILGRNKSAVQSVIEPGLKIVCDRDRLTYALLNAELYVVNRRDGRFRIFASQSGKNVLIIITNENIYDEYITERLFSPVYEYKQEARRYSDGLGLYILKLFCQRFGGEIYIVYGKDNAVSIGIKLPSTDNALDMDNLSSNIKKYGEDKFSPYHIALADVYEYLFF